MRPEQPLPTSTPHTPHTCTPQSPSPPPPYTRTHDDTSSRQGSTHPDIHIQPPSPPPTTHHGFIAGHLGVAQQVVDQPLRLDAEREDVVQGVHL